MTDRPRVSRARGKRMFNVLRALAGNSFDSWKGAKKDIYEHAQDSATEKGREEPSDWDIVEGFMRCIEEGERL
jgi:hypothetical protein